MSATLGRTVKDAIKLSGIPIAEVSRMIDLSASAMSGRLAGKTPFLCDELVRISTIVNVSLRDLLADWEAEKGRGV